MLSVSNYGTEKLYYAWRDVSEGHVMMPFLDFGDVQDNGTALHIAMHEIMHGDMAWGCAVLVQLREYICTTKKVKSLQWVLPQVDAALALRRAQQYASRVCRLLLSTPCEAASSTSRACLGSQLLYQLTDLVTQGAPGL